VDGSEPPEPSSIRKAGRWRDLLPKMRPPRAQPHKAFWTGESKTYEYEPFRRRRWTMTQAMTQAGFWAVCFGHFAFGLTVQASYCWLAAVTYIFIFFHT
jgi:hypothetical protein